MKSMPLISIVIPVYNVEHFLPHLFNSIAQQTYSNIEIVLVDDGSPDNSGKMCDEWAKEDDRIVVIHKQNGGLSDARNAGVLKAKGKYITFVDSDDYVSSDYVEYLWNLLSEAGADISCGNLKLVYDQEETFEDQSDEKKWEYSNTGACKELLKLKSIQLTVAWGKLYKRELLEKNPFPVGMYHEDEATVYKLFYQAKKVVVGNKKIYGYLQNNTGSITRNRSAKRTQDAVKALKERCDFFLKKREIELYKMALRPYLVLLINEAGYGNQECQEILKNYTVKNILLGTKSIKLKGQFLFYKATGKSLNQLLHIEDLRKLIYRVKK